MESSEFLKSLVKISEVTRPANNRYSVASSDTKLTLASGSSKRAYSLRYASLGTSVKFSTRVKLLLLSSSLPPFISLSHLLDMRFSSFVCGYRRCVHNGRKTPFCVTPVRPKQWRSFCRTGIAVLLLHQGVSHDRSTNWLRERFYKSAS